MTSKPSRTHFSANSSACFSSSGEDEKQPDVFIENRRKDLLQWTFKSEVDRKLILGLIDRNVKLDEEWDVETLKPEEMPQNTISVTPYGSNTTDIQRESSTQKKQQIKESMIEANDLEGMIAQIDKQNGPSQADSD